MRVIYVDDEQPALDNFKFTVAGFAEISRLEMFQDGQAALEYVKNNPVDAAFLDMEMPGLHGLGLALKLREVRPEIKVVFVTAYSQYAMDAWGVDATGYVLKPYVAADVKKELVKCMYRPVPVQKVVIQTIPTLAVAVNGEALHIGGGKTLELLALLVDRADRGITSGEGIACLWPDRPNDANTQSLFRMTFKRLVAALEKAGVGQIVETRENRRFLRADQVDCDLYRVLSGDKQVALKYDGQYLREYAWAEDRNSQLYRMLMDR